MADGTIITSVTDALAICSNIIESANNEVVYISPPSLLVLGSQLSIDEAAMLIQRGGCVRGIADFSYPYIDEIRKGLDIGVDVRHFPHYQGIFMMVGDRRESISSMSIDVDSLSIDTPLVALWSDNPTYVECLLSTFNLAWEQAVPAAQRIEELLKEGPPDI
ncbi:MAG: hypothetical protein WCE81_02090 [Halobacteriota archaeon]